jgi:hypothetical protein
VRSRRRRLQAHRHDARRRVDREIGREANFYGKHVLGSGLFTGSFKEFWVWEERLKFSTRLKFIYSVPRIRAICEAPHPFLELIERVA